MDDPVAWLAGRKVLLLSPHPDDIAYSIGGLVARAAAAAEMAMLTVFSRSAWALPPELRAAGSAAISAVRMAEDRAFCASHGVAHHALDFGDSSLEGYDEAAEMASSAADDARSEPVFEAIRERVRALAPDLVLTPAAIGGHIDHRIVLAAARRLDGVERAYYEDIPYAAWQTLRDMELALTGAGLTPLRAFDIAPVLDDKIAGMWVYRSQTDAGTIAEMLLHAERLGVGGARHAERIWS